MDMPNSSSSNTIDNICQQQLHPKLSTDPRISPLDELRMMDSPLNELRMMDSPLDELRMTDSPLDELSMMDSSLDELSMMDSSLDELRMMEGLNWLKCRRGVDEFQRERRHNALRILFNEDNHNLPRSIYENQILCIAECESDESSLFDAHPSSPRETILKSTEPYPHFIYYVLLHADDSDVKFLLMLYYDKFSCSPEKFKFNAYQEESSLNFVGFRRRSFVEDVKKVQRKTLSNTDELKNFYRMGQSVQTDCLTCYMPRLLNLRSCCEDAFCNECIAKHICVQLENGSNVTCPGCPTMMHSSEVLIRLKYSLHCNVFRIYTEKLKELALSSTQYMCPNCTNVLEAGPKTAKFGMGKKLENNCSNCGFVSCPACKSPRHEGLSCKQYQKGDKSMKSWADSEQGYKTRNATKCPKCKQWYQKTDGCDHMSCTKCRAEFCYLCGGKYRKVYLLGSHKSRFSVLGCSNNLLPNHSVLRKTIRGSLVVGAVAVTPVVVTAAAVGASIVLGVMATKHVAQKISRCF